MARFQYFAERGSMSWSNYGVDSVQNNSQKHAMKRRWHVSGGILDVETLHDLSIVQVRYNKIYGSYPWIDDGYCSVVTPSHTYLCLAVVAIRAKGNRPSYPTGAPSSMKRRSRRLCIILSTKKRLQIQAFFSYSNVTCSWTSPSWTMIKSNTSSG